MSVAGILSTSFYQPYSVQATASRRSELQQLGQDLQSGNLTAAQQDFATLTQRMFSSSTTAAGSSSNTSTSSTSSASSPTGTGSILQDLKTLGADLQSGDLSAAQQAYSALQQDILSAGKGHHHHHHGGQGSTATDANGGMSANDLMNLLANSTNSNSSSASSGSGNVFSSLTSSLLKAVV